jgi:hypothetical protein
VFDSFHGEELELNICDDCLLDAGRRGRVQIGRNRRPVHLQGFGICGWENIEWEPVTWNPDSEDYPNDVKRLTVDDFSDGVPNGIHFRFTVEQLRDMANDESWKDE